MISVLVKLLNWFFNNIERRFGIYTGYKQPPLARECPVCHGEGVLEGGDVCPSCSGAGRIDA